MYIVLYMISLEIIRCIYYICTVIIQEEIMLPPTVLLPKTLRMLYDSLLYNPLSVLLPTAL